MAAPYDSAFFVWDPGSDVSASSNTVDGGSPSGLTEGEFLTDSYGDCREYEGAEGSRFDLSASGSLPIDTNNPGDTFTLYAYARLPDPTADGIMIWVGEPGDGDEYFQISVQSDGTVRASYRKDEGTTQSDNWWWPEWGNIEDTEPHTFVARLDRSATPELIELFIDGAFVASRPSYGSAELSTIDRLTIGRRDDSSPTNSDRIRVYAAAAWDTLLTDQQIRDIADQPLSLAPSGGPSWFNNQTPPAPFDDECLLLWRPQHGGKSYNMAYSPTGGAPVSSYATDALPDGDEVTSPGGLRGRSYDGAVGSRFTHALGADGRELATNDWTAVVRCRIPAGGSHKLLSFGNLRDDSDCYMVLSRNTGEWVAELRHNNAGTDGADDWCDAAYTDPDDTDVHTVVATYQKGSTSGTMTLYVDDIGNTAADTQTINLPNSVDRVHEVTVGRLDDNSPANSNGIEIYDAVVFGRVLTSDEITAMLADPRTPDLSENGDWAENGDWLGVEAAGDARVTQVTVEALTTQVSSRVSQMTVEALTTQVSSRVSQMTVEALTTQMSSRVTQMTVEALFPEEGIVFPEPEPEPDGAANRIGGAGAIRRPPRVGGR